MTTMKSRTELKRLTKRFVPPFENGDHMDRKTFHALYEKTPDGFKAELIGGIVHMASPVRWFHAEPHAMLALWLMAYKQKTPGVLVGITPSVYLDETESEVQPDLCLRLPEDAGGRSIRDEGGYIIGPPEVVVEISLSSLPGDLFTKKHDYERYGVQEYLVIDVFRECVHWFVRVKSKFQTLAPSKDRLLKSKVFPGLWLDPKGPFELEPDTITDGLSLGLASPEHAVLIAKLKSKIAKKGKK